MDAQPSAGPASPFDDGELYDVMYQGLTYDTDFYVGLARHADGPVLEIACGTGRILLSCLQAGADVEGLDLNEPMLATLRRRAAELGLKAPALHLGDMSDFRLPRRYALILITGNAFCHNLTQEAQLRCLERCRQHLVPGGLLAFDGAFPGQAWVGAEQNVRVLEIEQRHPRTAALLRFYDTRSFDRVAQVQHSRNEVEQVEADGTARVISRSEVSVRWTYLHEMTLLLRVAGFARWEICGDFERRPLRKETDAMVVLAWAGGEDRKD